MPFAIAALGAVIFIGSTGLYHKVLKPAGCAVKKAATLNHSGCSVRKH